MTTPTACRPRLRLVLALLCGILFSACDKTLGYSVVLWHNDEHQLTDGEIVQVSIRSNISHVYVITLPDSDEKAEVPLWQLSEPTTRSKAERLAERYADYAHTYASVKLDGLPIRAEPVNTSKQVYRLRERETIRVLYKGTGQAVTNGKGNMEGDWLRVLTEEGTEGWCFSHNLELFQREGAETFDAPTLAQNQTDAGADEAAASATDGVIEAVKSRHWYPESFQQMIERKRIDISRMNAGYGFAIDDEAHTVSVVLEGTALSWQYSGITKSKKGEYRFEGTAVRMTVRKSDCIVVEYTDSDRRLHSETFVALSENIADVVQKEKTRRQKELEQLRLLGPTFESSNYGKLVFRANGAFEWSGYHLLVPSIIDSAAKGKGTVAVEYFISDALRVSYDGVLTFHFNGMESPVRFLYKIADGGVRLEDATKAQVSDNVLTSRSTSPLVIFFSKK